MVSKFEFNIERMAQDMLLILKWDSVQDESEESTSPKNILDILHYKLYETDLKYI